MKTFDGDLVEYCHVPGPVTFYKIDAIFDEGFREVALGGGTQVLTDESIINVQISKLNSFPKRNDKVKINGKTYNVFDVKKDSYDGAKLFLEVE